MRITNLERHLFTELNRISVLKHIFLFFVLYSIGYFLNNLSKSKRMNKKIIFYELLIRGNTVKLNFDNNFFFFPFDLAI